MINLDKISLIKSLDISSFAISMRKNIKNSDYDFIFAV